MSKVSAIVIAKNEENMIADCLESVQKLADEIIVVDNNSEDRTAEIAKRMGAMVYACKTNDFSDLRNFGLNKAAEDWILYVDADERVDNDLKTAITHLTKDSGRGNQLNTYFIKRKNFYLGNHEWPYVEKLERFFRKSSLKGWKGELHEAPIFEGEIGELEGFLLHYTHRDLASMLSKTIEWSKIEADLRYKSNHPKMTWWRFPRVMLGAFFDSYIKQRGWKAGIVGIIESLYQSFSIFITYARLWELQKKS
ncbi:MAG: glycosyltransferase family 2 protein [bacterium]|nr:glycosyltransferase family 2 protein [bacterium]